MNFVITCEFCDNFVILLWGDIFIPSIIDGISIPEVGVVKYDLGIHQGGHRTHYIVDVVACDRKFKSVLLDDLHLGSLSNLTGII